MSSPLVDRLRRGDPGGYRKAIRLHGDPIYAFLLRLSGRRDVADDLFQETWLALAQHAQRLAEDTRLEAWLYTVARNAFRNHRRWAWVDISRWAIDEPKADVPSDGPSPEEEVSATRAALALERAIAELRPKDREVILLSLTEGLEPADVAAVLELSAEAYRQRLSRARLALAQKLERSQNRGGV